MKSKPVDAARSLIASDSRQIGGEHYKKLAVQPWVAMESWLTAEEFKGFLKGNAIKYLARTKSPDDIAKAHHYLEKLMQLTSKESNNG